MNVVARIRKCPAGDRHLFRIVKMYTGRLEFKHRALIDRGCPLNLISQSIIERDGIPGNRQKRSLGDCLLLRPCLRRLQVFLSTFLHRQVGFSNQEKVRRDPLGGTSHERDFPEPHKCAKTPPFEEVTESPTEGLSPRPSNKQSNFDQQLDDDNHDDQDLLYEAMALNIQAEVTT